MCTGIVLNQKLLLTIVFKIMNENYQELIHAWNEFCLNFDPINKMIAYMTSDENMQKHLTAKFKHLYEIYGSRAVIISFLCALDRRYQKKLYEYFYEIWLPEQREEVHEYLNRKL